MISNLVIGLKSLSHKMTVPSFDPVAKPSSFPCIVNIAAYRLKKIKHDSQSTVIAGWVFTITEEELFILWDVADVFL